MCPVQVTSCACAARRWRRARPQRRWWRRARRCCTCTSTARTGAHAAILNPVPTCPSLSAAQLQIYHSPIACLLRAPCCPHSTACRAWSSSHDTGNPPILSCTAQCLFQAHCATHCKYMLGSDQGRMWQSACCHAPGLDAQPRRVRAAGRSTARRRHRPSHAGGHPAAPAGYSYHVLCLPRRVVGFMLRSLVNIQRRASPALLVPTYRHAGYVWGSCQVFCTWCAFEFYLPGRPTSRCEAVTGLGCLSLS